MWIQFGGLLGFIEPFVHSKCPAGDSLNHDYKFNDGRLFSGCEAGHAFEQAT